MTHLLHFELKTGFISGKFNKQFHRKVQRKWVSEENPTKRSIYPILAPPLLLSYLRQEYQNNSFLCQTRYWQEMFSK